MKTVHTLSTGELEKLEHKFEKPCSTAETLILFGVRCELQYRRETHYGVHPKVNVPEVEEDDDEPLTVNDIDGKVQEALAA